MLNVSKDTAAGLRVKLEVGQKTEEKLNLAREAFRPVATRGSILYFLVTDMALVNCMYQTSLAQFLERFDLSLERYIPIYLLSSAELSVRRILSCLVLVAYLISINSSSNLFVSISVRKNTWFLSKESS